MATNKETVDRVWELMESDRIDQLTEVLADDLDFFMPGFNISTAAEMIEMLKAYKAAFPDLHHDTVDYIEQDDKIALELRVVGTHQGTLVGPLGDIPATGKEVVWESVDYVRVRDGKVQSWHVYHDTIPFLTQVGLMQVPTTA
jgi:steroid delta-isomerase-like uncharacterized protein